MGDPSSLRFIPASSAAIPIDWTRVPEATKKFIKQYGYDWDTKEYKPLPATIGDLAKTFDETKFFGYFGSDKVIALMDISEFGLQPPTPGQSPVGPRFYMTYLDQVCFLLFAPGTRNCIAGNCEETLWDTNNENNGDGEDEDEDAYEKRMAEQYEKMAAAETAMAQAFDVKLEQEILQGKGELVEFTKKLAGWTAVTLRSSLESSQLRDAIMTLPRSHPLYKRFVECLFLSFDS